MSDTVTMTASWSAGTGPAGTGPAGASAEPGIHRLLPPGAPRPGADLAAHAATHGPLPYAGRARRLTEEIKAAGLTGRGGAGFPAAVKWTAVADGRGRPVVVGNGAEGEPASHKDKQLLWVSPHLVLDGLQLAAEAVGARRAYLYLHRHDQLHRLLADALAQRWAAAWDRVAVTLVAAPPRFLAGEESALASRIGGGLALPTFKQPRVFERGVGGAPTLVQNVETLAHAALIARHGAAWFRQAGTAAEPGTMLVTAHRADGASRVGEVPVGAPLADLLDLDSQPAQAVLTGGYHGTWLPAERAATLQLANSALRQAGATLGAGVLAALPPGSCGLAETARVLRYLAAESAGQCGPCLNGLPRIAGAFTELSRPAPDPRCVADLERWSGLVTGRGACHHPDGTVRLVRSALGVFRGEIEAHLRGRCTAGTGAAGGPGPVPFLPVSANVPAGPPGSALAEDWR
jgi:NADH:ubiquinone oxidoreductase subunit F (NADH-binding)